MPKTTEGRQEDGKKPRLQSQAGAGRDAGGGGEHPVLCCDWVHTSSLARCGHDADPGLSLPELRR